MLPTTESDFVAIPWEIMFSQAQTQSYYNLVAWRHCQFQTPSAQAPKIAPPCLQPTQGGNGATDLNVVKKRVVGTAKNRKASNARRQKAAPFKCKFDNCDSTFTRKTGLKNHIRAHLGEKIGCPSCRKEYSTRGSMVRHHKTAHRVQPAIDM